MKWSFTQIEGPEGKVLELDGYAAPFGRPRRDPVAKEAIRSRVQTTKYSGRTGNPTHCSFGVDWEPMELKGRWMTRYLTGSKTAADVADEWTNFVLDERMVLINWGSLVSYTGYIDALELGRESADEIAWKMHILIDRREGVERKQTAALSRAPIIDNMEAVNQTLVNFAEKKSLVDDALPLDLFDSLGLLIGQLNSYSANLNSIIAQVGDIEKASFAAIQSFRYGLKGFQTALISLSELIATTQLDAATFIRGARSDIAWFNFREDILTETSVLRATLAEMDRTAEIASHGESTKIILAQEGDSWESIATRATGGPEASGEIRRLNGIHYGQRPIAGETYLVP